MIHRISSLTCAFLVFLAATGCGPQQEKGVTLKGKIVLNGQPLQVENPEAAVGYINLELFPEDDADGIAFGGDVNQAGEFEFLGAEDKYGVEPGRYRLAVEHYPTGVEDSFNGALSAENSPIIIDVPESQRGLQMDLGTLELSKHLGQ